jgi:hypothetical protein
MMNDEYFLIHHSAFIISILSFTYAPSAVDRQDDAGNQSGRVAAKEHCTIAAIFRPTGSTGERLLGPQKGLDRWVAASAC